MDKPHPTPPASRNAYTWLPDAILDAMRELQEVVGKQYGILPVEVAVGIDRQEVSVRSVRRYMKAMSEQGKLKRLGLYDGYQLLDDESEE